MSRELEDIETIYGEVAAFDDDNGTHALILLYCPTNLKSYYTRRQSFLHFRVTNFYFVVLKVYGACKEASRQ